eukprot:SAG31_NODE_1427_length_8392_cov_5.283613_4_plen_59_part_00
MAKEVDRVGSGVEAARIGAPAQTVTDLEIPAENLVPFDPETDTHDLLGYKKLNLQTPQ